METPMAAEMFPAGEHLADEIDARGWAQADFAQILGRPAQFVSEIISGKREITRESAAQIAAALGTSAEFWLNLQDSYLLWKQGQDAHTRENLKKVRTRARLHEIAPVSLLVKRGFITSTDLDGQAREVLHLLDMESLDDEPDIEFAARRSNPDESANTLQFTWVACVVATARQLEAAPYSRDRFETLAKGLSGLTRDPRAFEHLQSLFADVGVKLVHVEAFPRAKVDGCAVMVDGSPVIGVSGRGKRLDKVLFTILHEAAHVLLGHLADDRGAIIDDLSVQREAAPSGDRTGERAGNRTDKGTGDEKREGTSDEAEADALARDLAIPGTLPAVPARPSAQWVREQADRLGVHPVVLIGRLQNDGLLSWKTTLVRGAPTVTRELQSWDAFVCG